MIVGDYCCEALSNVYLGYTVYSAVAAQKTPGTYQKSKIPLKVSLAPAKVFCRHSPDLVCALLHSFIFVCLVAFAHFYWHRGV